jgi:hypothetical protein
MHWLALGRLSEKIRTSMTDRKGKDQTAGQRLRAIMRGAFAGPPTPLKDIPTKEGESRKPRKAKKTKGKAK